MTNLQSYIVNTLAPEMDADILRQSLTDSPPTETMQEFQSFGVSFRPMFLELVQWLPDQTLAQWVDHLFSVEADPMDLPPVPAPQVDDLNDDLVEMTTGEPASDQAIALEVMADTRIKSDRRRIAEMIRRGVPSDSDFVALVANAKATNAQA